MPRQPVFQRSPLLAAQRQASRPGMIRSRHQAPARLLAMLPENIPDSCLEGAVRLAACGYPVEAARTLRTRIAAQGEDGSLPGDALALARAAWVLAEQTGERGLTETVARWLTWLGHHYDAWMAEEDRHYDAADLMSLAVDFYRMTGKRGGLVLLSRLRKDAFDWATALNTFSLQRPMAKALPPEELAEGLQGGDEERRAYCRQQAAIGHAECLADGMRATLSGAVFSGSGTGLEACRRGWERVTKTHGAVCGGTTADPMLEGASPFAAIDPAAVGAWTETLAAMAEAGMDWAIDPLERLTANALSSCALVPGQALRVNAAGQKDAYGPLAAAEKALGRLLRGWAAALSAAVMATPEGLDVLLPAEGLFVCPVGGSHCRLQTAWQGDCFALRLRMEQESLATLRLRVPAWAGEAMWRLNGGEYETAAPGSWVEVERMWQDGDLIELSVKKQLRVETGYHQSCTVWLGAELMALDGSGTEPGEILALTGTPALRDGRVTADVRPAAERTADMPVLPALAGETKTVTLQPFALAKNPLAVFAGSRA